MVKEVGYRIRIDEGLRQRFIDACRQEDRSAAQVIREFMRLYVNRHSNSTKSHLFAEGRKNKRDREEGKE